MILQFSRFAAVGATATALQFLVLTLGVEVFATDPVSASSAGYFAGAILGYVLNSWFTFRSRRSHAASIWRYVVTVATGSAINASLVHLGVNQLELPYLLAQAQASIIGMVWNFSLNRFWTFRET